MEQIGKYFKNMSLDSRERRVRGKKSRKSPAELADTERGLSITVVLLYLVHFTSPGSELMSCPGCVYI